MKPLILSFFIVLLGYSLFFDKEDETKRQAPKQETAIQPEAKKYEYKSDSMGLYAKKTNVHILEMMDNDSFFN